MIRYSALPGMLCDGDSRLSLLNTLPALQALLRTLGFSTGFAGLETLVKTLYIFVLHVPLFMFG